MTTAGHIYTVDSYLNYNVTKAIGTRGALDIPKFMMTVDGRAGRQYSKLGIGQSVAGLPLFWIGSLVEGASPGNRVFRIYSASVDIPSESGIIAAEPQELIRLSDADGARVFFTTLTCAFAAALVCLIFWSLLRRFGLSRRGALWGACLLGFATPLWVYSRDYFAEPLFTACLVGTFYLLMDHARAAHAKQLVFAGLASSAGILTRVTFLPLCAIFAAYLALSSEQRRPGLRRAAWYLAACVPGVVIQALLDAHRFGDVFSTGYHTAFDKGFSLPLAKGLWWNLASPYRSIFLYAPVVGIFGFGIAGFLRKHRAQAWLVTALAGAILLIYSKWWAWHGGWCWGPRFLLPAIPLLLVPGLVAARTRPWLVVTTAFLAAVGFAVQLAGVLINYTAPYDYWIKIGKLDWAEAGIQNFFPIAVHMKALTVTGPAHYDLWLIQAQSVIGWNVIWIVLGLGLLAGVSGWWALRPTRKPQPR
jgi:hypothetical protein